MSRRIAFLYSEEFQKYNFSHTHPLQPIRLKFTYELLKSYGVFEKPQLMLNPGRMATDEELLLVHAPEYIGAVKRIGKTGQESPLSYEFGVGAGDNPAFKGMHEAASYIAGSSIVAADLIMRGDVDHAVNIAGGLHHALKNRASGFCVYNDASCAIAHAAKHYGAKVAYIDIDAHHGDGVQWSFYDRSDVLTISLHESGRFLFPGTGFVGEIGSGEGEGYSINIPLEPETYDEPYIYAFNEIVSPLIRAFKPDLIVTQNGCDSHYTDPLAQLSLTTNAYERVYAMLHELAHEVCDGRILALGGGGYQVYNLVPRAWSLLTAALADIGLDNTIPDSYRELCFSSAHHRCPEMLRDKPLTVPELRAKDMEEKTELTVTSVKQGLFPYHGLSPD